MLTPRTLRVLVASLLLGIALSSFLLAGVLVSLLYRFAKDLAEVAATGEYIRALVIAGVLALVGFALMLSSILELTPAVTPCPIEEGDHDNG